MDAPVCLHALTFDIFEMMSSHPPVWKHAHKQAVYDRLLLEAGLPKGQIRYSRWSVTEPVGELRIHPCEVVIEPSFYSYLTSPNAVWHVNFADPRLFAAYGSSLLAQDELQALEHPVLGSLREALLDAEHPALTRQNDRGTPVLVAGAPRQCALNTESRPSVTSFWGRLFGRHSTSRITHAEGLYGNRFQLASLDQIMAALTVLNPPTLTNLIAIAAPTGQGRYTRKQIVDVLETACSGMQAAVLESRRTDAVADVEVHTGWWGCGAFGGNRSLMAMLQVLAARMAGIDRLVFHTGSTGEAYAFDEGYALLETLLEERSANLSELLDGIESLGYNWGTGDGN